MSNLAKIFVLVGVLCAAMALRCSAVAGEQTVTQKNRAFSDSEITIKKGDTVIFLNSDNVPHNIASTSPGNEFDIGSQEPGVATPVTFTAPGEIKVQCLIHPRMQLRIKVTD